VPGDDGPVALRELLVLRHLACHAAGECTCGVDPSVPLSRQGARIARALGARDPDSFEDHLNTVLSVYQAGLRAFTRYQPSPSDVPVTLFRSRDGFAPLSTTPFRVPIHHDAPYSGWEHARVGDFRLATVPGGHVSMFAPPHLWDLAAAIAIYLIDLDTSHAGAAAEGDADPPDVPADGPPQLATAS
jgi:hypothetical protein